MAPPRPVPEPPAPQYPAPLASTPAHLPVPAAGLPPELVHSILGSRRGVAMPLFPVQRDALMQAAVAAGASNAAIARIAAMSGDAGGAAPLEADAKPPVSTPAAEGLSKAGKPGPAEPAAKPSAPGEAPTDQPTGQRRAAASGGAPAGAPGPITQPNPAGGPGAVQQAATQTAGGMPHPPPTVVNGPQPPARRSPTPARQVHAMAGPPPVPMATPAYAEIPDPIPEATKKIEEAANRKLPDVTLPPVTASPGGHVPDVNAKPLTKAQRRFLLLGKAAMDAADLPAEERQKIRDVRDVLMAPPKLGEDGTPVKVELPPAEPIKVRPLPSPRMTLAQRDLFTAALAQLLADPAAEARTILDTLKESSEKFPGRVLLNPYFEKVFKPMGEGKLGEIEQDLRNMANPMAEAMGVAGKTLDDAVAVRTAELEAERQKAQAALQQGADAAKQAATDNADARNADAAKAKAVAADAKKRAGAAKKKPKPTFRETADAAAARIKDKVAEAIAGFQLMETERGKALDDARARQLEAYQDAVTADQLAASIANKTGPDEPPITDATEAQRARERVSKAINAAKAWAEERRKLLDTEVKRLKDQTAADTKATIEAIENEGAAAFRALKAWGDTQDGAVDTWWAESAKNLETWADKAHETATTWALVQGKLSRLQMQRDLEAVSAEIEKQLATEGEQAKKFAELPADQRQRFVETVVTGEANRGDIAKGLAGGMRQRLTVLEKPKIEQTLEADALTLPSEEWKAMEALVQSKDPGFHADQRSDTIYKSGEDKLGTDESSIYAALTGLSPLGVAAVKAHYLVTHGHTLDWALSDEMSGDELRRAQKLLEGDKGAAAAEAIHDAVWGPGTNEKQIMDALRGLSEDERKRAIAYYREEYDQDLSTRLEEDLSGADLDQAQSLLAGKQAEADAAAIDGGLRGHVFSPDRDSVTAVYDRVQQESLAKAKANGWTSAELDAEVALRNGEIEKAFGEKFAGVSAYNWGGSQSTLRTAITTAYPFDPANRKLINALADNDLPTADAALMQTERQGVYADDSVLKGVIRKQYDRAFERAQLDRGPEFAQRVDNGMKAWMAEHVDKKTGKIIKPFTEEERINKRMELQRDSDAMLQDEAFDRARANSKMLDAVLQANHGITLDNMIAQNMSWGDKRQAQSELKVMRTEFSDNPQALKDAKRARRLDWAYSRVRYSIEGLGTDMDELKGGLSGLSKDDLAYLDKKWRQDHDDESLEGAVRSDTSGREEDDLVDVVQNGAPQTVSDRFAEVRRKLARDEASVGALGAWGSEAASARSHRELAEMEALTQDLRNPNLDPRKREFLAGEVDRRIDHANAAIEAQRARVDAMADMLTTIAQYVIGAIAVIVGVIVAIVSGGTAIPALIAIAGSIIGTLSGMAIKAAVKGGAYGAEEFMTDAVVGAVDLAVTIATAGTVKGGSLLSVAKAELKELGKASIRIGIRQATKQTVTMTVREAAETAGRGSLANRAAGFIGRNVRAIAKNQAHQFATALPTALAANVMNERNLRSGNALKNIAHGTLDAAVENLKVGAVMGGAGHLLQSGLSKVVHVEHPPVPPAQARLAEYKAWQERNPEKPRSDYVTETENRAATAARDIEVARLETREARKALLDAVPPRERAGFADVPIVRVSEAEFKALNKGQPGDAIIFKKDGQAALVIREGASPAAVKELTPQLRDTVAPGTAGRTLNPAESLPPRLRNRVEVEVVSPHHDPSFGPKEVRAVPKYHPDGHIIGVTLQVGPQARAIDIQNHILTVDAMRKLTGLLGRVRVMAHDVQLRLGMDVVTPLERGRWEAALEIQKLPNIIEERIGRLAEQGLDPRRRALVMEEIAQLERQYVAELRRFTQGADAEARGYVAAKPDVEPRKRGSRAGAERDKTTDPEIAGDHAESKAILDEVRQLEQSKVRSEDILYQDTSANEALNHIREKGSTYVEALKAIRDELPRPLAERIKGLQPGANPEMLRDLHALLRASPEFQAVLERGKPVRQVQRLQSVGESLNTLIAREQRLAPHRELKRVVDEKIAALNKQFEALGGKVTATGVALHPRLPAPEAGYGYYPEARTTEAAKAHLEGYRAELRLANHVAAGGQIVVQYGHSTGINFADIVSVDPVTGRVTLWDSKFRDAGGSGHSDTFQGTPLTKSVDNALKFLNGDKHGLPSDLVEKARRSLSDGNFDAITSHTSGGEFTHYKKQFTSHAVTHQD